MTQLADSVVLVTGANVELGTEFVGQALQLGARLVYATAPLLIEEMPGGATRVAYDAVADAIAPCRDPVTAQVADHLDAEVLELLRG